MACKYAKRTDQYHGWECTVTEGSCMFIIPDSKRCAEEYDEGPDANDYENEKYWQCNDCGKRYPDTETREGCPECGAVLCGHCFDWGCGDCAFTDRLED